MVCFTSLGLDRHLSWARASRARLSLARARSTKQSGRGGCVLLCLSKGFDSKLRRWVGAHDNCMEGMH